MYTRSRYTQALSDFLPESLSVPVKRHLHILFQLATVPTESIPEQLFCPVRC